MPAPSSAHKGFSTLIATLQPVVEALNKILDGDGVTILGLVGPLFLFPSCPLFLLTHLGPSPSNSHHLLPIYSSDPMMRTIPTDLYYIWFFCTFPFQFPGSM